ncbi:MAG: glycosyltransferase [Chitinophagaceae bacterium]
MQSLLIIGPAHPLRGGLATFNQRLAQEFENEGFNCSIVSFSLQYPSILFPGKTQYSDEPAPQNLKIHSIINSVNPANWIKIGNLLCKWKPDVIVVRFWIPFIAPALGTILRRIRRNKHTKIICIADNIIPHEHRLADRNFTRYFLKACDAYITMSEKVLKDLRKFIPEDSFGETQRPALLVQHPLYDNFGEKVPQEEARSYLKLNPTDKIVLFFGFIRKYKGLDLLLRAMSDQKIKKENIKLLIAGEFYEDEKKYLQIIKENRLQDCVILQNYFIADHEVKYYLCASDAVIQPYRNATQSGVTPLAYHFEIPMIVTNVGGLPALVPHEKAGLVCAPTATSIAEAILHFYQLGKNYFIPHLRVEKQKYSWATMTDAILKLAEGIKK